MPPPQSKPMDASLLGRYKLYKASTKRFVEWLVLTARQCARLPTAKASTTQTGQTTASKKITTRDLVSFAQAIASSSRSVPSASIRLLDEVIDGRQACANWYALQPKTDKVVKENDSHLYFIHVIKEVHTLLSPNVKSADNADKGTKQSSSKSKRSLNDLGGDISNLFAQLEVEEPSHSPLGEAPQPTEFPETGSKDSAIELEEDDMDDTAFRLFCFLKDAKDVRDYLKQTWKEYSRGEISMLAATSTTEAGIGLLRISCAALVDADESFKDWDYLLNFFLLQSEIIQPPGQTVFVYLHPCVPCSDSTGQESMVDLADLICPASARYLDLFKIKLDELDKSDMGRDMRKNIRFINQEQLTNDLFNFPGQFFLPSLPEFLMWKAELRYDGKYDQSDHNRTFKLSEFISGVLDFHRTGRLPVWLPIALQVYCDIYEVIGSDSARVMDEYFDRCSEMDRSIAELPKLYKEHFDKTEWARDFRANAKHNKVARSMFIADSSKSYRMYPDGTPMPQPDGARLKNLLAMPCLAGSRLFGYKLDFHRAGVAMAGVTLELLCMAHIYTAGRKLGLISYEWRDMDLIIAAQKPGQPLVTKSGNKTDAISCSRQFLLALGVPASAFAKSNVPQVPSWHELQKKARRPASNLELVRVIKEGVESEESLGLWRRELIELILISLTNKAEAEEASSKSGKKKQHTPAGHFTPLQLLSTYKKTFTADEPMLNFDWFGFSASCVELLLRMTSCAKSELSLFVDPKDMELSYQFTYYALLSHNSKASTPQHDTALELACKELSAWLSEDNNTNKFSLSAFRQSSGRIPKDLRPNFTPFDRSTVETTPMMQFLMSEAPSAVMHTTAASVVIWDPQGTRAKMDEAIEIDREWWREKYKGREDELMSLFAEGPVEEEFMEWMEIRSADMKPVKFRWKKDWMDP